MVVFKEVAFSNEKYLLITDSDGDSGDKGTKLLVHPPIQGSYSGKWPSHQYPELKNWSLDLPQDDGTKVHSLKSLIHDKEPRTTPFQTLGRRIIDGDAHWGPSLRLSGAFSYIENYWEWLEDILGRNKQELRENCLFDALYASLFTYDRNLHVLRAFCEAWCPDTNTLHTSVGELSLSLWDLHKLGGLPIIGGIYEEVIPCAEELTGVNEKKLRHIPQSCEYLFAALHHLQRGESNKAGVSADQWINFWFKGKTRYSKPKQRRIKRASRAQATQNPDGEIGQPRKFSSQDNGVFNTIGVKLHLREESYLAAFISCWLCVFVLPDEDPHYIRPSTFKMASMMAAGRKTCLAVPVLLSIYRGLDKISNSATPGCARAAFPVHYVYAWLASYFSTHYSTPNTMPGPTMTNYSGEGGARYFDENSARDLIHQGDKVTWGITSLVKNRNELFIDDGKLANLELSYFVSACSNYLVLHAEGDFLVEPYSPYRFARQFGFYQVPPQELGADVRSTNYDLSRILWRTAIRSKTESKILFPSYPLNASKHTSSGFQTWWSTVHDDYLLKGRDTLIKSIQSSGEQKRSKGKELANLNNLSKVDNSLEMKQKTVRNEKEILKSSNNKVATLEDLTPNEQFSKGTSVRLPSKIVKAIDHDSCNSHEEKRSEPFDEEDEQSTSTDQHWKRKKSKLDDQDLIFIDDGEPSQISVEGPTAFELLAKQVISSTQQMGASENSKKAVEDGNVIQQITPQKVEHMTPSAQKKLKIFDPPSWPRAPRVSEFCPQNVISTCRRDYIQMLWNNLRVMISQTALERMPALEMKANEIIEEMQSFNAADISNLQGLLKAFFANAARYVAVKSSLSNKIPAESYDELLSTATQHLRDAQSKERQQAEKISTHMLKLKEIDREEVELRKRLEFLDTHRKETLSLLREEQDDLTRVQGVMVDLQNEVRKIENSPPLLAEESQTLDKMQALLESNQKELSSFEF
ncbi:uncharacterized protein [Coffea arabica]|uniref:Aminotransferase-like plant mobile domain-containing protein n=1 Tax=Coffea arabica TaxID=13443 RepID=A0ABM4WXQ4_COFAR